jgi:hypothetical protein
MSDLGSQPREVWKELDQLPAEGRLGSSENTSKPRRCLFLLLRGPLCICSTCLAFGAQYLDLDKCSCNLVRSVPELVSYVSLFGVSSLLVTNCDCSFLFGFSNSVYELRLEGVTKRGFCRWEGAFILASPE